MKALFIILAGLFFIICPGKLIAQTPPAQNSILANFGSSTCANSNAPSLSLLGTPLGLSTVLSNCNLSTITPNFYSVFVAYNPKDNKLYVVDIRSAPTRVWIVDEGLPGNISCPVLTATPTYTYSATGFVPNNFEFDANGDVWSLRSYNNGTGQCTMDKFDEATGTVLFTKTLQFPAGNFPNTIASGDLTILPNGRMFATFGDAPSKLFEITNYSAGASNANATFIQNLSAPCYGIAYLNGQLEITGTDIATSCYYYDYNITTNVLGPQIPFQNGQAPIDNTSITASIGTTKRILNQTVVNANTADLTYEIYVRNMGNVAISQINITEDLGAVFGAANISNVSVSFASGGNPAGLTLNAAYNGTTIKGLLNPGQVLINQTPGNTNYFVTIQVSFRVTNLNTITTYNNSAVGTGSVGSGATQINVADSSNNGNSSIIDPDNDGNAGGPGENVPTPFKFGILLPVKFISTSAVLINTNAAKINWVIATPGIGNSTFEIEKSMDGMNWNKIAAIPLTDEMQSDYEFIDNNLFSDLAFYRIKEIDAGGKFVYSSVSLVRKNKDKVTVIAFPNPARNMVNIIYNGNTIHKNVVLEILDMQGRKMASRRIENNITQINTGNLTNGVYLFSINNDAEKTIFKISVFH